MAEFQNLDVLKCPLEGVSLIEASAGTGKTWNICALFLRLLLEKNLTVQQILVVTFTKAATAELRDRVRDRITGALAGLGVHEQTEEVHDPFIREILERSGLNPEAARNRLLLALESFDEAAIHTIHSFCQRALGEIPFSSGLPFELEAVQDNRERIQQVVNDFWRSHIAHSGQEAGSIDDGSMPLAPMTPLLADYLIQKNDSPEKYGQLLRSVMGKPVAEQRWPGDLDQLESPDDRELQEAFAEARTLWQAQASDITAHLLSHLEKLNAQSWNDGSIQQARQEWDDWLRSESTTYPPKQNKLGLFRQTRLSKGTKKSYTGQTPQHVFFEAAERLLNACEILMQSLEYERLRLLRKLVITAPQALRASNRQHRVVAFDDMLINLHEALSRENGERLAASLRHRFPSALIDEFQDTDPIQFDIFRRLYAESEGPVFMVGDPKQAIYRFRNADLHTYLGAQSLARHCYSLPNNQRSTRALIEACNTLFGVNPKAFLQEGISYRRVERGEKPLADFCDVTPERRGSLQVWLLPKDEEGQWLMKADAETRSASAVAAEISRLLGEAAVGQIRIGDRPLQSADIAVLVRSHRQGRIMRGFLDQKGIGSVELSQASVFSTSEAEELERILLAIAERRDPIFRAALATRLMGLNASEIDALSENESAYFDYLQRFFDYRILWEQRGFAVMFRQMIRAEGIETRVLSQFRGERRLTNLLHLGELMAQAAYGCEGIDSQLRWFAAERREIRAGDDAQLRLESDSHLVQIVTIHKSKGLEYPIVFCPFLWDGAAGGRNNTPDLREYHEDEGGTVLDFDPGAQTDEAIKERISREDAAETLRLIYVALTRAVYRSYLVSGCYNRRHGRGISPAESTRSMLNWLVSGAGISVDHWFKDKKRDPEEVVTAWRSLADGGLGETTALLVDALPELISGGPQVIASERPLLKARKNHRILVETWTRGSFTGMIRNRSSVTVVADHDADIRQDDAVGRQPSAMADPDILLFPAGAAAGSCIHRVFELADFSLPDDSAKAIRMALAEYPVVASGGQSPVVEPELMLGQMLENVLATPLPAGDGSQLRLGELKQDDLVREMGFTLSAGSLSADRINTFLHEHGYEVPELEFRTVRGFLTGAIDLVFRAGGRFYLLDWKSNHLGYRPVDYSEGPIIAAMRLHAYSLQYLLYTVALHRYLQARMPGYDYDVHFGGVYYLFVRGVRPGWLNVAGDPTGVFFDRPARRMVELLDELIGREPGPWVSNV